MTDRRPRSPIEMMVDRACGITDAELAAPPKVVALDDETQALMNACEALTAWRRASKNGMADADHLRILNECADTLIQQGW